MNAKTAIDKTKKLVLGHAGKKTTDAITVDIEPLHHPDIVHDLNVVPYPFADNQFQEIVCHHVLEHLNDLFPVMKELHRICAPSGMIYIEVPHHSSWFAKTPEHKLLFNYFSFDGFLLNGVTTWMKVSKFKLVKREITFHKAFRQFLLHKIFNKYPLTYERFWTHLAPAEHLKFWFEPIK